MQIPLVDLRAQFQSIKPKIMAEIETVLESMQLFLGPQSQAFENEFAQYCGTKYGVGLSSGTDALALAQNSRYHTRPLIRPSRRYATSA